MASTLQTEPAGEKFARNPERLSFTNDDIYDLQMIVIV